MVHKVVDQLAAKLQKWLTCKIHGLENDQYMYVKPTTHNQHAAAEINEHQLYYANWQVSCE